MEIQKYMALLKIVEYESFTKAAAILHYSQSGISRMIQDLEKEWNITLLERNRSGVRLTSDGYSILPYVKRICQEYENLKQQIEQINGLQSGIIRIGTFSSVATHWLPKIIQTFQKDYPNMDYELLLGDYQEIESWILEGRVDCGFLRLPTLPELESIFLQEDKLLAMLPQNHPLADMEYFPINALCSYPFMLLEKGGKSDIWEIFQKHDISANIRFTTWDDYAIMSMVEGGLGISILPQLILKRTPYKIIAKGLEVPAYRKIGLALHKKKKASLAMKAFLKYIVSMRKREY